MHEGSSKGRFAGWRTEKLRFASGQPARTQSGQENRPTTIAVRDKSSSAEAHGSVIITARDPRSITQDPAENTESSHIRASRPGQRAVRRFRDALLRIGRGADQPPEPASDTEQAGEPPRGGPPDVPRASDEEPGDEERFILRTPSGEAVGVNSLLERSRVEADAEVSIGVFQPGDFVVFKKPNAEDEREGAVFAVTAVQWKNLAIDARPSLEVWGELYGSVDPDYVVGEEVRLTGSGYEGAGMVDSPNALYAHQSPYFQTAGDLAFDLSAYRYAQTFRDRDGLQKESAYYLNVEATSIRLIEDHLLRLGRAREIASRIGYNLDDTNLQLRHVGDVAYEDDRFLIDYISGEMGDGNRLAIFDKEQKRWMKIDYSNSIGQDILKIGIADLSGYDDEVIERIFAEGLDDSVAIRREGAAITTFATSHYHKLDAINYLPSRQDAHEQMGIPDYDGHTYPPNIHILPEGQILIPDELSNSMYKLVEEEHPGLQERVNASLAAGTTPEGNTQIFLGDKTIELPNPRRLLVEVVNYITLQS